MLRAENTAIHIVGFLSMVFSITMVPPLLVSFWYGDGEAADFALTLVAMLGAGGVLFLATRRGSRELRRRDGFLIVAGFWLLTSLLGAIPFMFGLHLSFVNALFESASGLTTTGATVVQGLDRLAPSILFYRQELQWFGGMGLIVLAVAVLPMLGIGGMSVYRAETPGPMKDEKLTPQLAHTARTLWFIYIGFTLACALGYRLAGMSEFDAIAHALSTVSTGGFSTHDASLGYYHSDWIEIIAILFMLAGGINFSVHFLALRGLSLRAYIADAEVRAFLAFVGLVTLTVAAVLTWTGEYPNIHQALMNASFETVSIVTSTGFGVADFSTWPLFLPVLMIFISFVGGCGGSTAGGMKVMRMMVLAKLGFREVRCLQHPRGQFPVRVGERVLGERTLQSIAGFFAVYVLTFGLLMLCMMATGVDQVTAFSAIATCMNNLGPGLGEVTVDFIGVSPLGKLVSVVAMLAGRLEIYTVLVLFYPGFWRS